MKIRELRKIEIPEVINLLKVCDLYYPEDDNFENLERKIKRDRKLMLVAEEKGKVIGFVMASCDGWAAIIWHLGVLPEYRNRGIAIKLVSEINRRLISLGMKKMYGLVEKKNKPMHSIIQRMGFEKGPGVVIYGFPLE